MANLLFSYPDIPIVSAISSSPSTLAPTHANNTVSGPRSERVQITSAANLPYLEYDAGVGAAKLPDHLIIARANLLKSMGATRLLLSGHNGGAETDLIGTASNFQTRTFSGGRGEDLIFTSSFNSDSGTLSGAYRYFKLYFGNNGSKLWTFGKAYFGSFFDFERDPVRREITLKFSNRYNKRPQHRISLNYRGITDAKRTEFITKIFRFRDVNPVFLYSVNHHAILNDLRLIHARIIDGQISNSLPNVNDISLTLEELV